MRSNYQVRLNSFSLFSRHSPHRHANELSAALAFLASCGAPAILTSRHFKVNRQSPHAQHSSSLPLPLKVTKLESKVHLLREEPSDQILQIRDVGGRAVFSEHRHPHGYRKRKPQKHTACKRQTLTSCQRKLRQAQDGSLNLLREANVTLEPHSWRLVAKAVRETQRGTSTAYTLPPRISPSKT